MDPLIAAWEVGEFLSSHGIRYAIIGGLAVQIWGESRLTIDADLTISAPLDDDSSPLVSLITRQFSSRVADPAKFTQQTRMILITASNGVDVDISLALPGYEDEMFARTVEVELQSGRSIRLCSAEDLIIHKAIAGRPQDTIDIQGVIYRQGDKLNIIAIRAWLGQFSDILENREILARFEKLWIEYQSSPTGA